MKLQRECGIWYHFNKGAIVRFSEEEYRALTQRVNPSLFLEEVKLVGAIVACITPVVLPIVFILYAIFG